MKNTFITALILCVCSYYPSWAIVRTELAKPKSMNLHAFEENKGQVTGVDASRVQYLYHSNNFSMFLLSSGIAYQFSKTDYPQDYTPYSNSFSPAQIEQWKKQVEKIKTETYRMDVELIGANPNATIAAMGKSEGVTNYYNRNVLDVYNYDKVVYQNIYPKIDWVVYTTSSGIKYDFVVHPGGNPQDIKLEMKGVASHSLYTNGSLAMKSPLGEVLENKPISYQDGQAISTAFKIQNNQIQFQLSSYDASRDLIIDPSIKWSSYYGGTGADEIVASCIDAQGNGYYAGLTNSNTMIASATGVQQTSLGGGTDAFIVRIDRQGNRDWATYYGGTGSDIGTGCAMSNTGGSVYLSGNTTSTTAIANGGHDNTYGGGASDGFLLRLNANTGMRQGWSTYYGSTGDDYIYGVHAQPNGAATNVYICGSTSSANTGNVIATGGAYQTANAGGSSDGYIVQFNSFSGARNWSTYYGGTGDDVLNSIAIDAVQGNVYSCGTTTSTSGIATGSAFQTALGGGQDGFLVKFTNTGVRRWGTYYGGSSTDLASFITAENTDKYIYISGTSASTSGISSGGHQNSYGGGAADAYLVKFDSAGTRSWATYYGGSAYDEGLGCRVNAAKEVYLCGTTSSSTNIAYNGVQNSYGGASDAYLVKFDSAGTRKWGTYYGGSGGEKGAACMSDGVSIPILSGMSSTNALTHTTPTYQASYGGSSDGFILKICDTCGYPTANITATQMSLCGNASDTFKITTSFSGSGFFSRQWYRNNTLVAWNNNDNDVIVNGGFNIGDSIRCLLISDAPNRLSDSVWSNTIYLNVLTGGTRNMGNITVCPNDTFWFPTNTTHALINRKYRCITCPAPNNAGTAPLYFLAGSDTFFNVRGTGCDSIINFNTWFRLPQKDSFMPMSQQYCPGDTVYGVYNKKYVMPYPPTGVASPIRDTIPSGSVQGCDSIVNIYISNANRKAIYISPTAPILNRCSNNKYITQGGRVYTKADSGTVIYDTFVRANGCDSIVRFTYRLHDTSQRIDSQTICEGQSYFFNGVFRTATGHYTMTLTNSKNCDSVIHLYLTVNKSYLFRIDTFFCTGGSITTTSGRVVTSGSATPYRDSFRTVKNCDSVYEWYVTERQPTYSNIYWTECSNRLSKFGNLTPDSTGIYYDTFVNSVGCDSFAKLNLKVVPTTSSVFYDTICYNGYIIIHNNIITATGIYYDTLRNFGGCDSFVTRRVTRLPYTPLAITHTSGTLAAPYGYKAYQWYRNYKTLNGDVNYYYTPSSSGAYTYTAVDRYNCVYGSDTFYKYASAISNSTNNNEFSIYPVPTGDYLYIVSDKLQLRTTLCNVYAVDGRKVEINIAPISSTEWKLDVRKLAKGNYTLQMILEGSTSEMRFTVE